MDRIQTLPIDKNLKMNKKEEEIFNSYISIPHTSTICNSTWLELKIVIAAVFVFLLLCNNYTNGLILKFPKMNEPLYNLAFKALLFFGLFYMFIIIIL